MIRALELFLTMAAWAFIAIVMIFALGHLFSRLFARHPHSRRPDGDEHEHWLGVGTAVSFHNGSAL